MTPYKIGIAMFKKPLMVEINVTHTVEIDLPQSTFFRIQTLMMDARKDLIVVIGVAAAAKITTEIITHIAKTKIK